MSTTLGDHSSTTSTEKPPRVEETPLPTGPLDREELVSACASGLASPVVSRNVHFPIPSFMLPRNRSTVSLFSAHSPPRFLSPESPTLNIDAEPYSNNLNDGLVDLHHEVIEDFQDRLMSIQARYPTINITGDLSAVSVRAMCSPSESVRGRPPYIPTPPSGHHHPISRGSSQGGVKHDIVTTPLAMHNKMTPVSDLMAVTEPPCNSSHTNTQVVNSQTSLAAIRKTLELLSGQARMDLLVDLVAAAHAFSLIDTKPGRPSRSVNVQYNDPVIGDDPQPCTIVKDDPQPACEVLSVLGRPPHHHLPEVQQATTAPEDVRSGGCSGNASLSSSVNSLLNSAPVFESRELNQSVDPEGNEMVNNYSLIGELGSGSFAKVHLAEHKTTGELVAVKIIKKSLRRTFARNAGAAQQIATEIALLKKVNHHNIIKLHGVIDDPDDDKVIMVMQYASGGPLLRARKVVRSSLTEEQDSGNVGMEGYVPITAKLAASYTRQVSTGLHYLHRHDILHRDIKPENLLLESRDSNRVLIADLGVGAMFSDSSALKKTAGTPAFFSPELCRGEVHLHGKASDIWALGVTTYTMVFGDLPFKDRNVGGLSGLLHAIQNDPLVVPESADQDLKDFMHHILDKDPLRRMTLAQLRVHPWIVSLTQHLDHGGASSESSATMASSGKPALLSNEDDGESISLTNDEIERAVFRAPSIKMLVRERRKAPSAVVPWK